MVRVGGGMSQVSRNTAPPPMAITKTNNTTTDNLDICGG